MTSGHTKAGCSLAQNCANSCTTVLCRHAHCAETMRTNVTIPYESNRHFLVLTIKRNPGILTGKENACTDQEGLRVAVPLKDTTLGVVAVEATTCAKPRCL
jgi:hypothetical protein